MLGSVVCLRIATKTRMAMSTRKVLASNEHLLVKLSLSRATPRRARDSNRVPSNEVSGEHRCAVACLAQWWCDCLCLQANNVEKEYSYKCKK